jgi:predicted PhzF superfamily epimerase YddE/YHI9
VEDHFSFRIAQGEAMGRAGHMQVDVDVVDGEPVLVKLTGAAVVAFSAEIKL